MLWQSIPVFLWPIVIEYYFKRLLGIRPSMLKSNWVYFLRIALPISISVRKLNGAYHISNPHTGLTSIVRPNSSDILVYIQIFFHKEYLRIEGLELPPRPTIIDLGANVGLFMLYCKSKWQDAVVSCLEPDRQNYAQLIKQIEVNNLADVQTINGGIWTTNKLLSITQRPEEMEWSLGVKPDASGNVLGITLSQLLRDSKFRKVDLLKMDIEGTEEYLFESVDFLTTLKNSVSNLIMETHNPMKQKWMATQLTGIGFTVEFDRELLFASKATSL